MSVTARFDARALKVCVASHHNVQPAAYKGLTYEACEALATLSKAKVIAPPGLPEKFVRTGASKIAQRLTGRHRPMMQPHRVNEQFDLFLYVCSVTSEIVQLERIQGWRERSRKAAVFVFESWTASADEERHYYRLFDQFDHVFLFNPSSVPPCSNGPARLVAIYLRGLIACWPPPCRIFARAPSMSMGWAESIRGFMTDLWT